MTATCQAMEARGASSEAPLVVFAGGGTGGHLFPVLGVAEALSGFQISNLRFQDGVLSDCPSARPALRFAFFGSSRPIDRALVGEADFQQQPVRPLSLKPWDWPGFYWNWRGSRRQCRAYFKQHRPAVVVGSGGFASGPPIREAAALGIPTVLLNPDAVPGRANRYLWRWAESICLQWRDSARHFSPRANTVVTGCPVRAQFKRADAAAGVAHFGLDRNLKTLLVTGASQGAASINSAMIGLADELRGVPGWQILHLAGARDAERTEAAYQARGAAARVVTFTDRMADAMAAADLIVSRAGASTLAEITALGKASVLLPYPYDRGRHQRANARMLSGRGAALLVEDRVEPEATIPALREALLSLMTDEGALARMAAAAGRMGVPDAADRVAAEVRRLALRSSEKRAVIA